MQKDGLKFLNEKHSDYLPLLSKRGFGNSNANNGILSHIREAVLVELAVAQSSSDNQELHTEVILENLINQVSKKLGFELTALERDQIQEQIEKSNNTFGLLQPLVEDPSISDIIISDFDKVCVQSGRLNYITDIKFPNLKNYHEFVEKILREANTTYSHKKPIADGMLGDFARIHAVHSSICSSGPYLTIRLNRFSSVNVDELIENGSAPEAVFNYLTSLIANGLTVLVVGEVGTGKTTLVRALAASISKEASILVIEDTPEIQLEHPHVRYLKTRESNSDGAGKVSPAECIRAGMRMAMNRIIFGEIRDAEAAESFIDVCASGHAGLSTIHARSAQEALARLELFLGRAQRGTSRNILQEQIANAVQAVVFVDFCTISRKRRIFEIREIGPVADGILRQKQIFKYELRDDVPSWKVNIKISSYRNLNNLLNNKNYIESSDSYLELDDMIIIKEFADRVS